MIGGLAVARIAGHDRKQVARTAQLWPPHVPGERQPGATPPCTDAPARKVLNGFVNLYDTWAVTIYWAATIYLWHNVAITLCSTAGAAIPLERVGARFEVGATRLAYSTTAADGSTTPVTCPAAPVATAARRVR
jgi:hypothetical protein